MPPRRNKLATILAATCFVFATSAAPQQLSAEEITAEEITVEEITAESALDIGSGVASWYGDKFAGRSTASGERFNPEQFTAAHRTLPFGSKVRVTRISSGHSVVVRINDRGPFHGRRLIDVSQAAARELGLIQAGSGQVRLELLQG